MQASRFEIRFRNGLKDLGMGAQNFVCFRVWG